MVLYYFPINCNTSLNLTLIVSTCSCILNDDGHFFTCKYLSRDIAVYSLTRTQKHICLYAMPRALFCSENSTEMSRNVNWNDYIRCRKIDKLLRHVQTAREFQFGCFEDRFSLLCFKIVIRV